MNVPPSNVLQIFVRNKLREGLTHPQIAALLRQRLRWPQLDPGQMTEFGKERYELATELLRQLEEGD